MSQFLLAYIVKKLIFISKKSILYENEDKKILEELFKLKVEKLYPEYCLLISSIIRKVKLCFKNSRIIGEIVLKVLGAEILFNGRITMVGSDV